MQAIIVECTQLHWSRQFVRCTDISVF